MQYVQTYFATEVRTPPLPLVALVGCADVHKDVGYYLSTAMRPPLVSLAVPDAGDQLLSHVFGTQHVWRRIH